MPGSYTLRPFTYHEELSGVLIGVSDADGTAVDADVNANAEVLGHEGVHAVALEHHLALKEGTLGHAGVDGFGFDDHDRLVLEEVVDQHGVDAEIFETALDDALLEVTVEAEHLNYN